MKKLFLLIVSVVLLSSCGPTTSALYYWGPRDGEATRYEQLTYRSYKSQTPESICSLLCAYEDMVSNPGGSRGVVPPGICAEYGYLLLQPEMAQIFSEHATSKQKRVYSTTDYATLFAEKGKEMMEKELELYPESEVFIAPLIKKFVK